MSNSASTCWVVDGVDLQGKPALVKVMLRDNGQVAVVTSTASAEPVLLGADAAAELRTQLGDALTISLRETRTTARKPTS